MKKIIPAILFAIMFAAGAVISTNAQEMMKDTMMSDAKKPIVAIIRADWCSKCRELEPTMMQLMGEYKDRLQFVVMVVSDDQKSQESAKMAEKFGLKKFFAANKGKTSTVAVMNGDKELFKTSGAKAKAVYAEAFDKAIK